MLYIIEYQKDPEDPQTRHLRAVNRFLDAEAARGRYGWTYDQLGRAMCNALRLTADTATTRYQAAHTLPAPKMARARRPFIERLRVQKDDGTASLVEREVPPGTWLPVAAPAPGPES